MKKWFPICLAVSLPFWWLIFTGRWEDALYWLTLVGVGIAAMAWLRYGGSGK